jgi:hypothetical protein
MAQNPYGLAFAFGRRQQLGITPTGITEALDSVRARKMTPADAGETVAVIVQQIRMLGGSVEIQAPELSASQK